MGSKIWFCALCSEGFTRKYSANRHNQNLHHGQGKIVRTIDYIIGRLASKYSPGDPLTYRSRYKQIDSSFARSDIKAFSFPVDSKISIAHDSSQRNSLGALPSHGKEHALDQQQQSNSNSVQPSITTPGNGKLDKIQELARALFGHEEAEAFLRGVYLAVFENGGKEEILDRCIEELKNKMNMKEAQRYLLAAPINEANKRSPLYGHNVQHLSESSRDKLTQIGQILKIRHKSDNAVFEEIKRIINVCNAQLHRQHFVLDRELFSLGGTLQANNQHEASQVSNRLN
jgi:hypothetical protein